jgi:hypothetical protein
MWMILLNNNSSTFKYTGVALLCKEAGRGSGYRAAAERH